MSGLLFCKKKCFEVTFEWVESGFLSEMKRNGPSVTIVFHRLTGNGRPRKKSMQIGKQHKRKENRAIGLHVCNSPHCLPRNRDCMDSSVDKKTSAILTRVWFHGAARDFSPSFQWSLFKVVRAKFLMSTKLQAIINVHIWNMTEWMKCAHRAESFPHKAQSFYALCVHFIHSVMFIPSASCSGIFMERERERESLHCV